MIWEAATTPMACAMHCRRRRLAADWRRRQCPREGAGEAQASVAGRGVQLASASSPGLRTLRLKRRALDSALSGTVRNRPDSDRDSEPASLFILAFVNHWQTGQQTSEAWY